MRSATNKLDRARLHMSEEPHSLRAAETEDAASARRIAALSLALEEGRSDAVRTLTHGLRAPDVADII